MAAAIVPLNRIKRSLIYVASITAAHYSRLVKSVDNTHARTQHARVCVCIRSLYVPIRVLRASVCVRAASIGQKRPGNNEISANVRGTGKLRRYIIMQWAVWRRRHLFNDSRSRRFPPTLCAGVMRVSLYKLIIYSTNVKRNVLRRYYGPRQLLLHSTV